MCHLFDHNWRCRGSSCRAAGRFWSWPAGYQSTCIFWHKRSRRHHWRRAGYWWWGSWVLKARLCGWESWTRRWAHHRGHAVIVWRVNWRGHSPSRAWILCPCMVELLPYGLVLCLCRIVFVEIHNVVRSLWILFLLLLRNATVVEQTLPFFRETLRNQLVLRTQNCTSTGYTHNELPCIVIVPDVSNVYRILRCRDIYAPWRPNQAVHKPRKSRLLP